MSKMTNLLGENSRQKATCKQQIFFVYAVVCVLFFFNNFVMVSLSVSVSAIANANRARVNTHANNIQIYKIHTISVYIIIILFCCYLKANKKRWRRKFQKQKF